MKEQFTTIKMDFTSEDYANLYKSAQSLGMRPQQFIQYALLKLVEE